MADFEEKDIAIERTTHPDAQWFPDAGLGLFLHWGIHSVVGVQASWAMINDYPASGEIRLTVDDYYAQADTFDPKNYDPERWLAAAYKAGFRYAVLTTKHHDGYTLWPSDFGEIGVKSCLGGRDLVQPFVDACRSTGMKVGLYFSFADWRYTGYPMLDVDFDFNKREQYHPISPEEDAALFEEFYRFTLGQISELLTRYGTIDLLWFDGVKWRDRDAEALRSLETIRHIRDIQPGIIVNNRWGKVGDYVTPEYQFPEEPPGTWWESCFASGYHWGYNEDAYLLKASWISDMREKCMNWDGNFLVDIGPAPDGSMQQKFYDVCGELASS
jgi:alpha-L-fucosidase